MFLILFGQYRTQEDLLNNFETYLEAMQDALNNRAIHPDDLEIANNLQNIRNSLASGVPDNTLNVMAELNAK